MASLKRGPRSLPLLSLARSSFVMMFTSMAPGEIIPRSLSCRLLRSAESSVFCIFV